MAYNERKMLEDVNGDLIPQYYDPVEDVFKPLTNDPRDVRLTGSNAPFYPDVQTTKEKKGGLGERFYYERISGSLAAGLENQQTVMQTQQATTIDTLEIGCNTKLAMVRFQYRDENGTYQAVGNIRPDGTGSRGYRLDWIREDPTGLFDILVWDEEANHYKLHLTKPMHFPNGVWVRIYNADTTSKNISANIFGRVFDA